MFPAEGQASFFADVLKAALGNSFILFESEVSRCLFKWGFFDVSYKFLCSVVLSCVLRFGSWKV